MSRRRKRAKPQQLANREDTPLGQVPSDFSTVQAQMLAFSESWSGPLPAPEKLEGFERVVPGSAERIIRMAEQEGEHVRSSEAFQIRHMVISQYLGMLFGFLIAAGGLSAAVFLAVNGHPWVAGMIGGVSLATIVGSFVKRTPKPKSKSS